jgi:hypothetical protein
VVGRNHKENQLNYENAEMGMRGEISQQVRILQRSEKSHKHQLQKGESVKRDPREEAFNPKNHAVTKKTSDQHEDGRIKLYDEIGSFPKTKNHHACEKKYTHMNHGAGE